MKRAYSTIEIKAVNDASGKRMFQGIATTPSTDRMGDVVDPMGMEFKLPIPFLWQHDSMDPIGWVRSAKATKSGITVDCEIASVQESGPLRDRLDTAWQMLKSGLVRGLSIGFNAVEAIPIKGSYGLQFLKTELLELSAVTIPANADCSITTIKSIDNALLAATGRERGREGRQPPGDTGTKQAASGRFFHSRSKGNQVKTLKELKDMRDAKSARMSELATLRKSENRKFNEDEATEFDALSADLDDLEDEIRIKSFDERMAAQATHVRGANSDEGSRSRGPTVIVKNEDKEDAFPGQSYVRMLQCKAIAFIQGKEGNYVTPADVAQHRFGKSHPKLVQSIKTAVAGGGTGSGEWGAELAQSDTRFTGDFVDFLYSMTIFDRLPLRSVPARVHIKGQDGASTGYWVGESKATPVSTVDFSDVELTPLRVGALAVCSKELVLDSSPSAEMWIRDSIAQASAQRVDTTFLSATAASAGVSPAGLLNGVSGIAASGTDADAVRNDLMSLYQTFLAAKNASGLVQIMTPSMAKALQLLRNSLGQREFPDIRADGGTLEGDPVYTGDNVTGGNWLLLKPSDIWKIGDGGVQVSMSDVATIEQNDAPQGASDTPVAASANLMSLWQTESIGFKVVRRINYAKRRTGAVAFVQDAEYGGVVS